LSFLEIRAERRQKSISVKFSFATVCAFEHHVSAADYDWAKKYNNNNIHNTAI
jgi:hypothetical protein